MKDYKKMLFVSIVIALASQISIGLMASDFRVSAGIISFVIFLYYYKDLKPIPIGILSGIMVYFLRIATYYISNGNFDHIIISYLFEILFYVFYSIIYSLMINKDNRNNINFVFFTMITSDFCANLIEIFVRSSIEKSQFPREVIFTLFFVSIIRSSIVWVLLNGFKYYKMLLLKEEHENRYKRLLWLTSQLKTEIYWMEKNMDNIEKVMSQSYQLFEKINLNEDNEEWGDRALSIARDVHEIKKENGLVVRGIQDITEKQLRDKGMDFKDIMNILYETMNREIRLLGKDIKLIFNINDGFYTSKHYYLMSMFRNLIMNSMDAMPDSQNQGKISVVHEIDGDEHCFIISDNGTGMDEESLKDVFSPGFSTKINYDTGEINRGLGLSIVKYIVEEQLEGKVEVKSKLEEGTSFYIKVLKSKLEENLDKNLGDIVGTADNGITALDDIKRLKPDIVLVDLLMPGKDGISLVKEAKPMNVETQYIMISQVSSKDMISKAYESGIEYYISKPIDAIEVQTVIKKVSEKINMNKKLSQIQSLFSVTEDQDEKQQSNINSEEQIKRVMQRIGIMGESGSEDIIEVTKYLVDTGQNMCNFTVKELCSKFADNPKTLEQKIRRTATVGMINLANIGIEDYMNEIFTEYSNGLYNFQQLKIEMDFIRGKTKKRGRISIRKFIDGMVYYGTIR